MHRGPITHIDGTKYLLNAPALSSGAVGREAKPRTRSIPCLVDAPFHHVILIRCGGYKVRLLTTHTQAPTLGFYPFSFSVRCTNPFICTRDVSHLQCHICPVPPPSFDSPPWYSPDNRLSSHGSK